MIGCAHVCMCTCEVGMYTEYTMYGNQKGKMKAFFNHHISYQDHFMIWAVRTGKAGPVQRLALAKLLPSLPP